jgi:rod shape-determining protein MreB and related proteins
LRRGLIGGWRKGLAMDLGTANTLIYRQRQGIVLNEPSVVALDKTDGKIVALGAKAKSFIGRTPDNIRTVRPLKDGVIADYIAAQEMIDAFLKKVSAKRFFSKPAMVIGVPSGITAVEKRAVLQACERGGASRIKMMEEPIAAAIGAGLDVASPEGKLVMDIGGGTTEVALISLFSAVTKESLRVAGDEMDQAIMQYLEERHGLLVGEVHAEQIKLEIGAALPQAESRSVEVRGKDRNDSTPRTVVLTDVEVRKALEEPLKAIEGLLMKIMTALPPDFLADIEGNGLTLAGGGALLPGLATRLAKVSGLRVQLDQDPLSTVVRGAGIVLENMKMYRDVFIN